MAADVVDIFLISIVYVPAIVCTRTYSNAKCESTNNLVLVFFLQKSHTHVPIYPKSGQQMVRKLLRRCRNTINNINSDE